MEYGVRGSFVEILNFLHSVQFNCNIFDLGYAIVQCAGDTVFIPAGACHQVKLNLESSLGYQKFVLFFIFMFQIGTKPSRLHKGCGGLRFSGEYTALSTPDARISSSYRNAHKS